MLDPISARGLVSWVLVAVFDGMGGAGGTVYETPDGPRTGAYLASRVARDVVEQRMLELLDPEWNLDGAAAAEDLPAFRRGSPCCPAEPNSTLRRARCVRNCCGRCRPRWPWPRCSAANPRDRPGPVTCLWAGDSRVYVFEPDAGAHQLTIDDIRDAGDAMANLRQDSVVSNAMSADTAVRRAPPPGRAHRALPDGRCDRRLFRLLGVRRCISSTSCSRPCVMLRTPTAWSAEVQARISAVTGDDAAMAVLGVGADHDEFRELFAERTAAVEERWVAPLDDVRRRSRAGRAGARRPRADA